MKKLSIWLMCLFAMLVANTSVKAQEVTITLIPGWTWISCPTTDTVDFATALGDFAPMQGDIIKSQWGASTYLGNRWRGAISQFYAGYGYHYYSNRAESVQVTMGTPLPQVSVTTAEPTDITSTTATCGGSAVSNDGTTILMKGVCWATHPQPTTNDSYSEDGNDPGDFTTTMTELDPETVYYVRAYAVSVKGINYGEELSFTTEGGSSDHAYVDLGLPSGLLWATCNVGADNPEDYGDYFAWGETTTKDTYNWSTYQYCNGSDNTLTKYCNRSSYGYNGFTDNQTTLLPEDDAATANWGDGWRMPIQTEWQELLDNTTVTWTTQNDVYGCLFTATNGNSLFLPAAGYRDYSILSNEGSFGYYWSSSLCTDYPLSAWILYFGSDDYYVGGGGSRCSGLSVRPVRAGSQNTSFTIDAIANPTEGGEVNGGGTYQVGAECTLIATANEGYTFTNWTENDEVVSVDATYFFTVNGDRNLVANFAVSGGGDHAYVDLGLPSGLLWATCNVGADNPEDYGDYFAWGETQPKDTYNWSTYQYCMGTSITLTKYCNNSGFGNNGFTDNLTTLLPEDDVVTANWGDGWRMPTKEEFEELYTNTTVTWTTQNGVNGRLFTASNGNSLFLPAAGYRINGSLYDAGGYGFYWSSSLITDDPGDPGNAWILVFYSGNYYVGGHGRYFGQSVRPVRVGLQSNIPTGAIDGKFTINDNGDQVYFSQGNLQYQASTDTWKFAENQWDYVGDANSNISSTYDGWIDLFGWGTSGYHDESDPYNVNYQPWSTSASQVNSSYNYFGYGPSTNMTDPDLTGTSANYDWGVYNPISNGGNIENGGWRTLTRSEWNYVFNTRYTMSGIRYVMAMVNNVNGVVLLPDNWRASTYVLNSANAIGGYSYTANIITAEDWVNVLEANGAVFLPAAGYRNEFSVGYAGSHGRYWSASYIGGYSSSGYSSYFVTFGEGLLLAVDGGSRYYGWSVRLVTAFEN